MVVKRTGQILGQSDSRIWQIHFALMNAVQERLSLDDVHRVGAWKMILRNGHNHLSVFADWLATIVILAPRGTHTLVLEMFVSELL
jgi:hypothetical protein